MAYKVLVILSIWVVKILLILAKVFVPHSINDGVALSGHSSIVTLAYDR